MHGSAVDSKRLIAAIVISSCFGSIHAYGVLLSPIELWLGISRGGASLGYSTALLALTAGVFVNGRLPGSIAYPNRLLACGTVAAIGLALAALIPGLVGLILGFGLAYGLANGIAYSLSLDIAARAMPGREAAAMGMATAAYGLGAVAFAQLFNVLSNALSVADILLAWAAVLLAACLLGVELTVNIQLDRPAVRSPRVRERWSAILRLWTTYLFGAFGGLMVLAHAPGLAAGHTGEVADAGLAAGIVSAGSVAGGYLGGVLVGKTGRRWSIALPMLSQTAAISALLVVASSAAAIISLGIIGLSYGILIAAIPATVRSMWGTDGFAEAYGKVFTAWGVAGLIGPAAAGILFDATHSYVAALTIAGSLSAMSAALSSRFPE